ncbi:hypothetical protein VNO78_31588 [Psophocarpus tetragonolobus]|uniref:Uncharacterized protein n=1 Tax=Psophocarpus tetragonolobus TaxID=3891 RepID=A0AAN9RYF4_PSOTE
MSRYYMQIWQENIALVTEPTDKDMKRKRHVSINRRELNVRFERLDNGTAQQRTQPRSTWNPVAASVKTTYLLSLLETRVIHVPVLRGTWSVFPGVLIRIINPHLGPSDPLTHNTLH